jgi:phospholipase C
MRGVRRIALAAIALLAGAAAARATGPSTRPIDRVEHVIVIYLENWSFDGLFGRFRGANGIDRRPEEIRAAARQVDREGKPYQTLPQPVFVSYVVPPAPDRRFPADLPVRPFDLAPFVPPDQKTGDLVHRYYQQIYQINHGRMDRFVAGSDAAGLVMSYYDAAKMPLGDLARRYTLCDHFCHSAFGGSWLNHIWLIAARMPRWANAPKSMVAQLDKDGQMVKDGEVTPDGYVINDVLPASPPHPATTPPDQLLPALTFPTIGDRLSAKNISWAWYSPVWSALQAGRPEQFVDYEHQPFIYFANYAAGTPGRAAHLKDESEFLRSLTDDTLPAVCFLKPRGSEDGHPLLSTFTAAQDYTLHMVRAVQTSRYWSSSVIFITFDENGGRWDHVAPPVEDRWGPGARVPALVVSPLARKGYVDHTHYETVSILKFIETRWNLAPLSIRDAAANDLARALESRD